jgi:hypothetical protein
MESKYWGQEQTYKNQMEFNGALCKPIEPPKPNTELSFGANDGQYDFLINYRRAKPLNRFQIWMYKVCFGIRARNI